MNEAANAVAHATKQNEELIHAFWDVNHKMRRIYDGKASQSRILIILQERGILTQRALTEHLHIQPGSASEILSKMESTGLIARKANAADRRTCNLTLTEKGQALAEEAAAQRRSLHEKMFSCLTTAEKATLLELLEKVQADWCTQFPRCAEKMEGQD